MLKWRQFEPLFVGYILNISKNIFILVLSLLLVQPSLSKENSNKEAKKTTPNSSIKNKNQKPAKKQKPVKEEEKQNTGNKNTVDPAVIKGLTKELDFLNKKLTPRLQEKKAMDYMKKNKNSKAIHLLESLEDSSPRSLLILAHAYENQGDFDNQIRVLKKLVKKNKKNGKYLIELAKGFKNRYFQTGLFKHREEAVAVINTVYKLDKKYHEQAHLEMLKLLQYKEDSEETNYAILKLLQQLIREFGMKRAYIKEICKYFFANKFYSQSRSGCKKAMRYDPKEPSNYVYYALSLEKQEDMEKGLKKAVKKFPKSAFVQMKTGFYFAEQKDYPSALPYFERAVQLDSNSAEIHLGLAQSLFHTRKEKKSYKHFLKACMLNKPQMLWAFKQAKSILNQKSKFTLAASFEKGITKCFLRAKSGK